MEIFRVELLIGKYLELFPLMSLLKNKVRKGSLSMLRIGKLFLKGTLC